MEQHQKTLAAGKAGERFAVRNSAISVVEGCDLMDVNI